MRLLKGLIRQRKGVSLVELVVSVVILGIILSALLGAFVMARISAAKAKHHIEAINNARAAMEQYMHDGTTAYSITSGDLASLSPSCTVVPAFYSTDVEKVTVTVSWEERMIGGGGPITASEQLVTLIEPSSGGGGDGGDDDDDDDDEDDEEEEEEEEEGE